MYNKEDYRHRKPELMNILKKDIINGQSVSFVASVTGIPIIVLYEFIKEDMPDLKDFTESNLIRLRTFYGV